MTMTRTPDVAAAADDIPRARTADDAVAVVTRFTGDREELRVALSEDLAQPAANAQRTAMRLAALRHLNRELAPFTADTIAPTMSAEEWQASRPNPYANRPPCGIADRYGNPCPRPQGHPGWC